MEYVYVIGGTDKPYKIGTAKDVKRRFTDLQISSSVPLYVHLTADTQDGRALEQRVHTRLSRFRVRGEWFDCSIPEIEDAMTSEGLTPIAAVIGRPIPILSSAEPMSGASFVEWVKAMKTEYGASDLALQEALCMSEIEFMRAKLEGAQVTIALACRALYHRFEPWK